MTNLARKKLSRRDAIKILVAATGATVLVPSKWSTPRTTSGVLPVHAQTSTSPVLHTLACGADILLDITCDVPAPSRTSTVTINPPDAGIPMNYQITTSPTITVSSPALSGQVNTVGGVASLNVLFSNNDNNGTPHFCRVEWSFADSAQGSGICTQEFTWYCT